VALVESNESSNRLEGIRAPRQRLEAIVLRDTRPRNRSEQEIAGYRDVLQLLHEQASEIPFSSNVILQFHRDLYGFLPQEGGRWKAVDNEIVEKDSEGNIVRVRFHPTPAVVTPGAMDTLVREFEKAEALGEPDALVLIPATVLDFLCIHPFTDGNGRIARLLTLQLLYRAGYEVGRYISLERHFESSRETYYETLEASSRGWHEGRHDLFPWLRYFWGVLLHAYAELEARVGTISGGRGSKTRQVRAVVEQRITPFSISEIERDCPGVSRELIRRVLRAMKTEGMLRVLGRGRGARWIRVEADQ
jgi:Fic family protein